MKERTSNLTQNWFDPKSHFCYTPKNSSQTFYPKSINCWKNFPRKFFMSVFNLHLSIFLMFTDIIEFFRAILRLHELFMNPFTKSKKHLWDDLKFKIFPKLFPPQKRNLKIHLNTSPLSAWMPSTKTEKNIFIPNLKKCEKSIKHDFK